MDIYDEHTLVESGDFSLEYEESSGQVKDNIRKSFKQPLQNI